MADRFASANNSRLISRDAARRKFADALRMFVGRGKRFSVKQTADGSGVPERMIETFKSDPESTDYREPHIEDILSLASFIGPEFSTVWLSLATQGAFWLPDADETPPGELAADLSEDTAHVARRAADGKFCRDDKHHLKPVGLRMIASGARLAFERTA